MSVAFDRPFYHGTISRIDAIDVSMGRWRKDFGQGFYMAMDIRQAIGMMHKKYHEALWRRRGGTPINFERHLYRIALNAERVSGLNVKVFERTDAEWLDFGLKCRAALPGQRAHGYDLVVGATADDDTMIALRNYNVGIYGPVGSAVAKGVLLSVLEPENLGVQCCICRQEVVSQVVSEVIELDWRTLE